MKVEFEDEELRQWMVNREYQNPISSAMTRGLSSLVPSRASSSRYRKKVKLWLLFTRTPAQLQRHRALSRLTGPPWAACDGLEPEDVATDDGVHMILETLVDAFHAEHETELIDALEDTFYGLGTKKGEKLHDYARRVQSNVRELPKQGVRLPDQVKGLIPPTTPGEPEHSSPHYHHDTGGKKLVFWRCEEGVHALRRRDSARPKGTRRAKNRKEILTWIWKKPMFKRNC